MLSVGWNEYWPCIQKYGRYVVQIGMISKMALYFVMWHFYSSCNWILSNFFFPILSLITSSMDFALPNCQYNCKWIHFPVSRLMRIQFIFVPKHELFVEPWGVSFWVMLLNSIHPPLVQCYECISAFPPSSYSENWANMKEKIKYLQLMVLNNVIQC